MYDTPRVHTARLQAGSTMEDDHDVFAQVPRLFRLTFSQPFARRYHQHNRHDAPGNSEHRQKCPQLVRPQGAENIEK
jgi:hypothetical protein